jgi:hypothetical protein
VAKEPVGNRIVAERHSPSACSAGCGPQTDARLKPPWAPVAEADNRLRGQSTADRRRRQHRIDIASRVARKLAGMWRCWQAISQELRSRAAPVARDGKPALITGVAVAREIRQSPPGRSDVPRPIGLCLRLTLIFIFVFQSLLGRMTTPVEDESNSPPYFRCRPSFDSAAGNLAPCGGT